MLVIQFVQLLLYISCYTCYLMNVSSNYFTINILQVFLKESLLKQRENHGFNFPVIFVNLNSTPVICPNQRLSPVGALPLALYHVI